MPKIQKIRSMFYSPSGYVCCRCKKTELKGWVDGVAEEDDDEGRRWRMFCPHCWKKVKHLPALIIYVMHTITPEAE